jgi:glutamate--cysteine ligase
MGFERYADYLLDVPMYFVYRNGQYIDASGQSFRDFLKGKLPALPGEMPTTADWSDHATTAFPEVRLKKFLEMRGADGGPWDRLCALPALFVGLLYDQAALDAAWDLVKNWTAEDRANLKAAVPTQALKAKFGKGTVRDLALETLKIARHGLNARKAGDLAGTDESGFLNVLQTIADSGECPAEEKLKLFHGKWGGSVDPVYSEFAY